MPEELFTSFIKSNSWPSWDSESPLIFLEYWRPYSSRQTTAWSLLPGSYTSGVSVLLSGNAVLALHSGLVLVFACVAELRLHFMILDVLWGARLYRGHVLVWDVKKPLLPCTNAASCLSDMKFSAKVLLMGKVDLNVLLGKIQHPHNAIGRNNIYDEIYALRYR